MAIWLFLVCSGSGYGADVTCVCQRHRCAVAGLLRDKRCVPPFVVGTGFPPEVNQRDGNRAPSLFASFGDLARVHNLDFVTHDASDLSSHRTDTARRTTVDSSPEDLYLSPVCDWFLKCSG